MSCKPKVCTFQKYPYPEAKAKGRKHSVCGMGLEACNHRLKLSDSPKTLLANPDGL